MDFFVQLPSRPFLPTGEKRHHGLFRLATLSVHSSPLEKTGPWTFLSSFPHGPFFPLTSSSPELILPSVVATQVEPSIAQSVAAAYYPGADKCEPTALPLYLWRGRGILSRRG